MRHPHRALLLSVIVAGLAAPVPSSAAGAPDLDILTAQQAAADLCASKFTSTTLVSAALARAKANPDLNAFITLDEAGAMKAAAAFDAGHRKRSACKPLGGVPIVIKDNIEVAGLPSSAGTPALKGFVPKQDAPVAEKLRAAGAIIIGKTNMHELAFGISGYNTGFKSGAEPGCATPTITRRSRAAPPPAPRPQSGCGSSPRASAPTPAARCGFPAH
jgi:mandelamide amidase